MISKIITIFSQKILIIMLRIFNISSYMVKFIFITLKKGEKMKSFFKSILTGAVALTLLTTVANADAAKGQKIYAKKLKKACGMNGAKFAAKHTQDEWKAIGVKGMQDEIKKICPNAKPLKEKYLKHLYDFSVNFASDSGNVPSC